jgi:hypothetical protein
MSEKVDDRSIEFTVDMKPKTRIIGILKRFHAGGKAEAWITFKNIGSVDFPGGACTYFRHYAQFNLDDDFYCDLPTLKAGDSKTVLNVLSTDYAGAMLIGLRGDSLKPVTGTWYLYCRAEDGRLRPLTSDGARIRGKSKYIQEPRDVQNGIATLVILALTVVIALDALSRLLLFFGFKPA